MSGSSELIRQRWGSHEFLVPAGYIELTPSVTQMRYLEKRFDKRVRLFGSFLFSVAIVNYLDADCNIRSSSSIQSR
ncbi:unnamed protein product [Timema podura]|uniref:Uncharacterized protein n=1 Tax=Timema podura TaxID=61482 RepID=A0ABN7PLJ7_TIMPD|nr:unnamed protein product [Timema podura]